MNKPIRYYSNSQQNLIEINYPIQQNFRPFNLNRNRFQQQDEIYYIQNDFQNYERKINQDHQQVEQNRSNFQNNKYVQDISRNFTNNNNNNDNNNDNNNNNNNNDNSNSQEIQRLEQNKLFYIAIDLLAVFKLLIALILITIFYYNRNLQQYIIDDDTFELNLLTYFCMCIPIFIFTFIISVVYREDKNPPEIFHKTAIITYTLIFEYFTLSYSIFLFNTLDQGFIFIQISLCHIILILLVFIVRPRYNISIRKLLSIIIVPTLLLVLFMSIFFQDKYFWWMFGIPVMIFLLAIKMFEFFEITFISDIKTLVINNLIAFLSTTIVLFCINSIKKKLS